MQTTNENKMFKRTFLWMPKLDFYVFREYMIPFSVLIFAFTLLFMIGDVFTDIDKFLDHENGLPLAVKFFVYKIPGNIRFVLPITVLLSCMYTLANFGRHREITAMRASGISLFRCAFPIYIVAFIVMLFNFWFNEELVPDCTRTTAQILRQLNDEDASLTSGEGLLVQYPTWDNRRNWMFGQFNLNGSQYDVRLKFFEEYTDEIGAKSNRLVRKLDAKKVDYIPDRGWLFYHCQINDFDIATRLMIPRGTEEEYLVPSETAPETPDMVVKAVSDPALLSIRQIYEFLQENPRLTKKHIYQSHFYQHIAFPWACFLCSFLSLPLAAKNERSGIFTAILSAVAVIVVYQVTSEIFLLMGKNAVIPPIVAGMFPTVAFAIYGLFLAKKAG